MKKALTIFVFCAAVSSARGQSEAAKPAPTKAAAKTSAKTAAKKAGGLAIPADAKPNGDGTFSWTDKSGQKWRYVKGPFGVMRSPDAGGAEGASSDPYAKQFVSATENGDTVTLVRQTPFGPVSQVKKKADLTEDERALLTTGETSGSETAGGKKDKHE